ncbi:hypothetical protein Dsin_021946 [Dipteronia sinensis]|uniref:Cytochrome P450 n=1 Tax=Dipteronia sinensis TaxID=43782 RepID=A0AAE0A226_9ROSI|nr:hypothetical protein Dsin_021946 [Dipteronia sinensis]
MEITSTAALFSGLGTIAIAWMLMRVVNWVWLKSKKLEKFLRQQGFSGNSYRLFHGDMKEITKQASTKAINISDSQVHNIVPCVLPFNHHINTIYGKKSFIWNGPIPNLTIADPKMIREIFFKNEIFQKHKTNSLVKWFVSGMVAYEGEQWFKVRKIASPAFHQHKLKDMFPSIYWSCNEMISKWKILVSNRNHLELDVWPDIQTLTADIISRTAFGSSYEDGMKIFELIKQQTKNWTDSMQFGFLPGWRFLPTALNRRMKSNYNETRALIKGIIHKKKKRQFNLEKQVIMMIYWVTKILQEALRLYSPASILTRTIYKETKLGEINLPPRILLSLPLVMVHHDHENWGDDADRFSEGVSKASKNNEVSFFPFGGCIGQNFALMEAKLALAMILQNFSFELSPAYVHAPTRGVTVQPQYGAQLI